METSSRERDVKLSASVVKVLPPSAYTSNHGEKKSVSSYGTENRSFSSSICQRNVPTIFF
uniref:Uncharacterized protein n=1 Tax=Arundo donax TaxID=35708 RepID=A0A0A9EVH5_ARUDO